MSFWRVLVLGSSVFVLTVYSAVQIGMDPVCSCLNPTGICAVLCVQSPPSPGYPKFIYANRTQPRTMARIVPQDVAPARPVVFMQRTIKRMPLPITPRMRPPEACETVTETETQTERITRTRTKTHMTIRIHTRTKTLSIKEPFFKTITFPPVTKISTIGYTETLFATHTLTLTKTLPAVTHEITQKSIQVLTPVPITTTKMVRSPPSIYINTRTVTVTMPPPRPVTKSYTVTSVSVVTATRPLYPEYVDIRPLPKPLPGMIIEFHDSNNKSKRVNVVMPTPTVTVPVSSAEKLFSNRPKTVVIPPVTVTSVQYITQTTREISTLPLPVTKTVTTTATQMLPIMRPTTFYETITHPDMRIVPRTSTIVETQTRERPTLIISTTTATETTTSTTISTATYTLPPITLPRFTTTVSRTTTVSVTATVPVPQISNRYITTTEIATMTKQAAPVLTTYIDGKDQYEDIINQLRNELEKARTARDRAQKEAEAYRSETDRLNSLLNMRK
ncbi:hypothetical protein NEHOM01_1819 [Nematocida homosporus]|uniref:uncharacterized protein n=1 Tax=Nematocida homosporus TaxID=1912981 RepID=UPI00221E4355|nr:uncharacterized protein NEHOM01_1819 [Nematocida homosporus]KAI5186953.1 hypothetical protein NEHOM01_1819 [Nematocida homosporus]